MLEWTSLEFCDQILTRQSTSIPNLNTNINLQQEKNMITMSFESFATHLVFLMNPMQE